MKWIIRSSPIPAAILQTGKDLLVLTVSSGISATYQSAVIAAQELEERYPERRIRVADSLSGSLGEGLLLWHACKMRDAGVSLEQNARWLAKKFAEARDVSCEDLVTIAHGDCPEDAEALANILREEYGVRDIHIGYVDPILGAHTGPGVLGLFYLGTER